MVVPSPGCRAQFIDPAYVVTSASDTIRGFILNGTDFELSYGVSFATTQSGPFKKYSTDDLTGFVIKSGRLFRLIDNPKNAGARENRFFAKRILTGRINLYSFGSNGFVFEKGDTAVLVRKHEDNEERDNQGLDYTRRNYDHVAEMMRLMNDEESRKSIAQLRYSHRRILHATKEYNQRFAREYPVTVYRNNRNLNFRAVMGTSLSHYQGARQNNAGLFVEVTNFENSKRISFLSGVGVSRWDSGKDIFPTGVYPKSQQYVALFPIGINIQSNPTRIQPFAHIDLGIAFTTTVLSLAGYDQYLGKITYSTKTETDIVPMFANVAVGAKIYTGTRHAIIVEMSRTAGSFLAGNYFMANIGYMY